MHHWSAAFQVASLTPEANTVAALTQLVSSAALSGILSSPQGPICVLSISGVVGTHKDTKST